MLFSFYRVLLAATILIFDKDSALLLFTDSWLHMFLVNQYIIKGIGFILSLTAKISELKKSSVA
jgi:hypothetical protein